MYKPFIRRYSSGLTHLTLSDKAKAVYLNTDPMEIFEYYDREDDNGNTLYTYTVSVLGYQDTRRRTAEEMNAWLESWEDD